MKESIGEIKFYKVSFDQFKKDLYKLYSQITENEENDQIIKNIYDDIDIPVRSTNDSAGYDFKTPFSFELEAGTSIVIPTGIRAKMPKDYYLAMHVRSSMGFRNYMHLANTTGIIDSDYYKSDNEGHIMLKLVIPNNISLDNEYIYNIQENDINVQTIYRDNIKIFYSCNKGEKIAQGIFNRYFKTCNDDLFEKQTRNGGIGSSDGKSVI